jgi:hypothetical protein
MDNAKARCRQPEAYHSVRRGLCGAAADKVCRENIEVLCCKAFIFVERESSFGKNKRFMAAEIVSHA